MSQPEIDFFVSITAAFYTQTNDKSLLFIVGEKLDDLILIGRTAFGRHHMMKYKARREQNLWNQMGHEGESTG